MWFFKGLPSRIGHLLDISLRDLERVLYFEAYVVVDPMDTKLVQNQLLTEDQFRKAREEHGYSKFKAQMGAEAIKALLRHVSVDKLAVEMRERMRTETSVQKKLKFAKRLKVVDAFRKSSNKPEWMILDVVPVIPPELTFKETSSSALATFTTARRASAKRWSSSGNRTSRVCWP